MIQLPITYPEITATPEEIRDWVELVQAAAVKARSIAFETGGEGEHLKLIDKYLFDDDYSLNVITVTTAMLESEVTISDLININYIVSQSVTTQAQIGLRQIHAL